MKYKWTPWPESRDRKMQIRGNIPTDENPAHGFQHRALDSHLHANELREAELEGLAFFDLRNYARQPSQSVAWIHRVYHSAIAPPTIPLYG